MRKFAIAAVAAVLALAASGCALIQANQAVAQAVNDGISLVTTVYIQHHAGPTATSEYAFAQQVKGVATDLQGVITGTMTVTQFNAAAQAALANISDPVKKQIAGDLLAQLDIFFAAQVANKGSLLNATVTAASSLVFGDIIAATANFPAPPMQAHTGALMMDAGSAQLITSSATLGSKKKAATK